MWEVGDLGNLGEGCQVEVVRGLQLLGKEQVRVLKGRKVRVQLKILLEHSGKAVRVRLGVLGEELGVLLGKREDREVGNQGGPICY